jgi:hypothetical protein
MYSGLSVASLAVCAVCSRFPRRLRVPPESKCRGHFTFTRDLMNYQVMVLSIHSIVRVRCLIQYPGRLKDSSIKQPAILRTPILKCNEVSFK